VALVLFAGCPNPGNDPPAETYSVTYNPNDATEGSVPTDTREYESGEMVSVADNAGHLGKSGFSFSGWNTREDGSGTTFQAGQQFPMGSTDVTLFARWTDLPTRTVSYDGNGSTSGDAPVDGTTYTEGQTVTVLGNPGLLANGDLTFMGWNTSPDGTGVTYTEGQTFFVGSESVTLYARWVFYLRLVTGGPYETWIGSPWLALNASDNSGDVNAAYEWDLDGDGDFSDASGPDALVAWADLQSMLGAGQYPADPASGLPKIDIAVKLTHHTDRTAVGWTTLTIYQRQPVAVPHWAPQPAAPIIHAGGYTATVRMDNTGSYSGDPAVPVIDWKCKPSGTSTWTSGATCDITVDLGSSYPFPPEGVLRTFILQVTDASGSTTQASFDVRFKTLAGTPPAIAFSHTQRGVFIESGEALHVDASATTDPDGYGITRVQWDVDGDGSWDIDRSGTVSDPPSLLLDLTWAQMTGYPGLTTDGQHAMRIAVTNAINVTSVDGFLLTIASHALVPVIHRDPAVAGPKDTFAFDASGSRHRFPDGAIVGFLWDFDGDGDFEESGEHVPHVFNASGTFTVTLGITDARGRTNSVSTDVMIE